MILKDTTTCNNRPWVVGSVDEIYERAELDDMDIVFFSMTLAIATRRPSKRTPFRSLITYLALPVPHALRESDCKIIIQS